MDIKSLTEGVCFLCGLALTEGFYVHYECAVAYADHKSNENRAKQIRTEQYQDRIVDSMINKKNHS